MRKDHALQAAAIVLGCVVTASAQDVVLDFDGPLETLTFDTPIIENGFAYRVIDGGLFRGNTAGTSSAPPVLEGLLITNGGTLSVSDATDPSQTFQFVSLDVGQFSYGVRDVVVEGFVADALVATDVFTTRADFEFVTGVSSNLSGVWIDELRIHLDATLGAGFEQADTLVLSIPEPSSLALSAAGGLCLLRRRRAAT